MAKAVAYALALTSPALMKGAQVRLAQERLNKNPFQDFLSGKVDGEYGKVTASATRKAKFLLGFPTAQVNGTYGDVLDAVLRGDAQLPVDYRARRPRRRQQWKKQHDAAVSLMPKALVEARKHVGYHEAASGQSKFGVWYGIPYGAWCAQFTTFCAVTVGSKSMVRGSRYAYVPFIVSDALRGLNGLDATGTPTPGCLVCFDWEESSNSVADHVGFFIRWLDDNTFEAVEGNTSNAVAIRQRERSSVECFVSWT